MSSYAGVRAHVLELIEPQAHVRCLVYEPPTERLQELVELVYAAGRQALIGLHLASVG